MKIAPFETELFFARYEFSTPHQLCNSDCESMSIRELLELAGIPLEQFGEQRLTYTETQGHPALRESISSMYDNVDPDDVVVLGTPVEGIYLTARALLDPGDEVIVLSPAYDALINLFEHVAGPERVKKWVYRPAESSWELDLDDLRTLISSRVRLVVVNFPHNPTGFLPGAKFQRDLAALVEEHDCRLFCDEMYFGLVHSGTPAIPSAVDVWSDTIVLSGLSKTYGLPGLRCGWLVVKDPALRADIMNWKNYTSICPPAPTEFLAVAALGVREQLRQRNVRRIESNLERAGEFFLRWPQLFTWRPPRAGSTALVAFHVPSVAAVSGRLAEDEGILIQAAGMLGGDDRHMRIGLGRDGFAPALGRFEDWLNRESASL